MPAEFVPASADFPQISTNRTIAEIVTDLLGFVGGESDDDQQRRAFSALETAVREFNVNFWSFNRVSQDITLGAGRTFSLNADFAAPERVRLLDANNEEVFPVIWADFTDFKDAIWDETGPGSCPLYYTTKNSHEGGEIMVWPKLVTPLQWPKMRVYYFRRIVLPAGMESVLNVPQEVEEALASRALSILVSKNRGFEAGRDAMLIARDLRRDVEARYRAWPDH